MNFSTYPHLFDFLLGDTSRGEEIQRNNFPSREASSSITPGCVALPLATPEHFRGVRKGIARNTSMANVAYRVSLFLPSASEIAPTQLGVMDDDASLDGNLFRCISSPLDVSPNTRSQKGQCWLKALLLMFGSGCLL
ncbi:hypothetical protein AVEN_254905-1 [Araneus ventricosus]|uniref:Uncharacterized protein n=1 Tax=Araneus ventricosus TaxID=182803 RepID=A0A4Y2T151_ARAVE|nr:hypothetical protein AVEN_254905-1 [Araneus ventricosus]